MSTKTNIHSGWNNRNAYGRCGSFHALKRLSRTHTMLVLLTLFVLFSAPAIRHSCIWFDCCTVAVGAVAAADIGAVVVAVLPALLCTAWSTYNKRST